MNEWMSGRRALRAGLLLGLLVGIADAAAVLIENPNSFTGLRSPAAFLGASVAMHLLVGALAGGILATTGIGRRISEATFFAIGLGAFLFLWFGIRAHVRWFFGEPLTSVKSLPAYAGIFAGSVFVAFLVYRALKHSRTRDLQMNWELIGIGAFAVSAALVVIGRPHSPSLAIAPVSTEEKGDILLITLDTTRADHLSCYGYPRGTSPQIDRIARQAFLFENSYASIPLTNPSHAIVFTGRQSTGVQNNGMRLSSKIPTFVELLAEQGWNCAAFVSGIPLKAELSGLARGFSHYDDQFSWLEKLHSMATTLAVVRFTNRLIPVEVIERRSERTVAAAIRWLEQARGPRFLWVHLFDPHTPYDAPRVMRNRFANESKGWLASGKPVEGWPIADYDAEIRTMDEHLGDLLQAFQEANEDRGFVVITADHGEGLEEHGQLTHGQQLYEEDLRVPTIISGFGANAATIVPVGESEVVRRYTSIALIGEWIRSAAGLPSGIAPPTISTSNSWEGPSLRAQTYAPEGRQDKTAAYEIPGTLTSFDSGMLQLTQLDSMKRFVPRRKIIVNWSTGEEVGFDLWEDPGETRPISDRSDRGWQEIREIAEQSRRKASSLSIDPEVERRLKSLGYIH